MSELAEAVESLNGRGDIKCILMESSQKAFSAGISLEDSKSDRVFQTLDTFNRHPEKVAMAACAQLINCLNSLYLAHEDKFVVTPVGHVFGMYASHQGGEALRTIFSAPTIEYDRDGKPASFWGLKGRLRDFVRTA